jgi:hypothetical protein
MPLIEYLLQCFLITLPILISGVIFIYILNNEYFPWLDIPLDFNISIKGIRIFGANKTFRGLVLMPLLTFFATLIITLAVTAVHNGTQTTIFPFTFSKLYLSPLLGLAYVIGEMPNSFLKRRFGIMPGKKYGKNKFKWLFVIADNCDSLIACSIVLLILYKIPLSYAIGAFAWGNFLHLITDRLKQKTQ